jgi:hypothetical protein
MAADEFDRAALFAAYRAASAPLPERREGVLARLRRPNARLAIVPDEDERMRLLARVIVLAIAAAVLAVLGLELGSAGLEASRRDDARFEAVDEAVVEPDEETAIERGEVVGAARRRVVVPAVPPPRIEPAPIPEPTPAALAIATKPTVARPRVQTPEPELDTEDALMERARAALRRSAWTDGKSALDRVAQLFPNGERAEERRALVIIVDCRIERSVETRLRARDYIVQHARSPELRRIIEACRASRLASSDGAIVDPFGESPAAE